MKKLLLISVLFITLVGCKKTTNTPAPVTQAVPPALSSTESQLIGIWIMDSVVSYTGAIRTQGVNYSNPSTCRLDLQSTISGQDGTCRAGFSGIVGCNLVSCEWRAPASTGIYISGTDYIITQLTTNLFRMNYTQSGVNFRYYFHK